jgi:hypothetical protein
MNTFDLHITLKDLTMKKILTVAVLINGEQWTLYELTSELEDAIVDAEWSGKQKPIIKTDIRDDINPNEVI